MLRCYVDAQLAPGESIAWGDAPGRGPWSRQARRRAL